PPIPILSLHDALPIYAPYSTNSSTPFTSSVSHFTPPHSLSHSLSVSHPSVPMKDQVSFFTLFSIPHPLTLFIFKTKYNSQRQQPDRKSTRLNSSHVSI